MLRGRGSSDENEYVRMLDLFDSASGGSGSGSSGSYDGGDGDSGSDRMAEWQACFLAARRQRIAYVVGRLKTLAQSSYLRNFTRWAELG